MTDTKNQSLILDARALARKSMEIPKVKRFYKGVTVGQSDKGFYVELDGRQIKTPGKSQAIVPSHEIAELMGEEWRVQEKVIDPHTMPVTRLINTAIDSVAASQQAVIADITGYGDADLLCYRAEGPIELVDLQAGSWDEILDWARDDLGASLEVASGVIHIPQSKSSLATIRKVVEKYDVFTLSALASLTNLLGSILLALAVAHKRISAADAWAAAHIDEDWQVTQWGDDTEASERRDKRWIEMEAAAQVVLLR